MNAEIMVKKRRGKWIEVILLSLIFAFAVDVLDMSGIIISVAFVFCFCSSGETKVDKIALSLLLFGAFYLVSLALYEGISIDLVIKFLILPIGTYYIGHTMGRKDKGFGTAYKLAQLLAVGFFIHALLNLASYISIMGIDFNAHYRKAFEFWRGGSYISVTCANLYSSPMVFFALATVLVNPSIRSKMLAVGALAVIIFAMLLYQNRTTIVALALVVAYALAVDVLRKGVKSRLLWFFVLAAVCVGAVLILDIGGIRTWVASTSLFGRMTGSETGRVEIWASFLFSDWWRYPFGGKGSEIMSGYVHNMWLDTWWRTGIIPFITLVYATICIIKPIFSSDHTRRSATYKKNVLTYTILGMLINFAVEPIFESNPFIFYYFTLVGGAIHGGVEQKHCLYRL